MTCKALRQGDRQTLAKLWQTLFLCVFVKIGLATFVK